MPRGPTWFDSQLSAQERLEAYAALSVAAKQMLRSIGYQPGTVPTQAQLEALYTEVDSQATKELVRTCANASARPSLAAVNDILRAVRIVETVVNGDTNEILGVAEKTITMVLAQVEASAYAAFRQFPTAERYAVCFGVRRAFESLGREPSAEYPANPWPRCRIRPPFRPGQYVVVRGDSLSKIAKRFYGDACLWDAIYEHNGYPGHPDRIVPGQIFNIV
jgi:nucleoid-associated protein YgaU